MEHGAIVTTKNHHNHYDSTPLSSFIIVSSIAAGVQFGWALQLSLLTPYVQLLGVPHTWASFIWLCGPVSGLLVQPIAGYYSDRCKSRFGRRRPFIIAGTVLVSISIILIGFAADLGIKFGDSLDQKTKPRAVAFFVVGFWILDVANNMLQGPCRAFLADLSGNNHQKMRAANSYYSFFMALGNVLGYAAGSYAEIYKALPFTKTHACDVFCANLKTCFVISICLLVFVTILATTVVSEKPHPLVLAKMNNGNATTTITNTSTSTDHDEEDNNSIISFFGDLFAAFKELSKPMWILLLVTAFNWIAWFPFLLFDTDWMGTEVYGGKATGNAEELKLYDLGVRAGSLGLMVNSVVLAFASLAVEPLSRVCGGVRKLWGLVNIILALCLAATVLVTNFAEKWREGQPPYTPPSLDVKAAALGLFGFLGIPQAATYSIPFALASIFCTSSGAGQGLSLGLLNVSICIPQMIVSVISGPIDNVFGGGNLPAFIMGAIAAAISGYLAFFVLPNPPTQAPQKAMEQD